MPELPDVEVYRRYFEDTSLGKNIDSLKVMDERLLVSTTPQALGANLTGKPFLKVKRHGKYLFAGTENNKWLVMHFGMTGRLKNQKKEQDLPEHSRLLINFDGERTVFINTRRLAKIFFTEDIGSFLEKKGLGPDALEISRESFRHLIGKSRKTVKAFLMDQSTISGIGNIYADEILFQAKVHPGSVSEKLDLKTIDRIYNKMLYVLSEAVSREADPDRFPDTWLLPNRKESRRCPRCKKGRIKKTKINGRPTYYCTSCQRKKH